MPPEMQVPLVFILGVARAGIERDAIWVREKEGAGASVGRSAGRPRLDPSGPQLRRGRCSAIKTTDLVEESRQIDRINLAVVLWPPNRADRDAGGDEDDGDAREDVGVSRTPQHPKDAKRKEMTTRPAKGAMYGRAARAPKTTTSRPAAVTAKRRMPPQRYELRTARVDVRGPCARLRQSMPSADAQVPTIIRKTPRPQTWRPARARRSCMTKAWTRSPAAFASSERARARASTARPSAAAGGERRLARQRR